MIPLEWMLPVMFGSLAIFMLISFPVAFSLMADGLFFSLIDMSKGFL
jgi:TRAP-type mannitol/chloroaromatic compound transport system permease large subunit